MSDFLGLKNGVVQVNEYTTKWKSDYESEKILLVDIFGVLCLDIEHIGSTSIPNLVAKPMLDIAIKVNILNQ